MHRKLVYALISTVVLMAGPLSSALTLEEYGVVITGSGLVDTTSGLQWLNPDLTMGTTAALDPFIEDGWRIASGPELNYLLTRSTPSNPLAFEDLLVITETLGLVITDQFGGGSFSSPWLCMSLYDGTPACQMPEGWAFTQLDVSFNIVELDDLSTVTELFILAYLTEVPLYGNLEGICDTCVGRTFLVRNVPLPAGIWLMLSALGAMGLARVKN